MQKNFEMKGNSALEIVIIILSKFILNPDRNSGKGIKTLTFGDHRN